MVDVENLLNTVIEQLKSENSHHKKKKQYSTKREKLKYIIMI